MTVLVLKSRTSDEHGAPGFAVMFIASLFRVRVFSKSKLRETETPVSLVVVVVIVTVRSPAADALFPTRSTNTSWSRGATRDRPGNAWPRPFSKRCWRWRWDDDVVLPPT